MSKPQTCEDCGKPCADSGFGVSFCGEHAAKPRKIAAVDAAMLAVGAGLDIDGIMRVMQYNKDGEICSKIDSSM